MECAGGACEDVVVLRGRRGWVSCAGVGGAAQPAGRTHQQGRRVGPHSQGTSRPGSSPTSAARAPPPEANRSQPRRSLTAQKRAHRRHDVSEREPAGTADFCRPLTERPGPADWPGRSGHSPTTVDTVVPQHSGLLTAALGGRGHRRSRGGGRRACTRHRTTLTSGAAGVRLAGEHVACSGASAGGWPAGAEGRAPGLGAGPAGG